MRNLNATQLRRLAKELDLLDKGSKAVAAAEIRNESGNWQTQFGRVRAFRCNNWNPGARFVVAVEGVG